MSNKTEELHDTPIVEMNLNLSIRQAIKKGNLTELEQLLRHDIAVSSLEAEVELAASRLADKPRFMKRKEAVDLFLTHGWDINRPLGIGKFPLLR